MDILDKAKDIAEVIKKLNDIELYKEIIDLRDEIFGLKEENRNLREQKTNLEEQLKTKGSLAYEAPYYWLTHEGKRDGPFCQSCQDNDGKLIRLQNEDHGGWRCLVCKNFVQDKTASNYSFHGGGCY